MKRHVTSRTYERITVETTPEHLKQEILTTCIPHYYSRRQSEKYGDYGKRPQNNQFSIVQRYKLLTGKPSISNIRETSICFFVLLNINFFQGFLVLECENYNYRFT